MSLNFRSDFPPFLPSFLPSFLHLHHHHQHRPSSSVIEIAQISMVIIIINVPSPLPSILPCSVLPSSFLPPSITSAPPLCWCRWRRRCRPVAGVNKQNQFLEFLKESKVRCFSKTKEIPRISHLKSGKNPEIVERKVTTQRVGIRSCKNSRNFWTFCNCAFLQLKKALKMCWLQCIYEREDIFMKGKQSL